MTEGDIGIQLETEKLDPKELAIAIADIAITQLDGSPLNSREISEDHHNSLAFSGVESIASDSKKIGDWISFYLVSAVALHLTEKLDDGYEVKYVIHTEADEDNWDLLVVTGDFEIMSGNTEVGIAIPVPKIDESIVAKHREDDSEPSYRSGKSTKHKEVDIDNHSKLIAARKQYDQLAQFVRIMDLNAVVETTTNSSSEEGEWLTAELSKLINSLQDISELEGEARADAINDLIGDRVDFN